MLSIHGGHFDPKDFLIKQGVSGHVMQLQTILKIKFEDFLVMISLNLLNLGYLKRTVHKINPL